MSNNNHFKLPSQGAKIIKFPKLDNYNYNYYNLIQELSELKDFLQENEDKDYELLPKLCTARDKYQYINDEIYNACNDACDSIFNLPSKSNPNLRKTKLKLIIISTVRNIDREIKKLKAKKINNTIHLGRDDR